MPRPHRLLFAALLALVAPVLPGVPPSVVAAYLPPVPVVTVPADVDVEQGDFYRYLVRATNDPTVFAVEGLPSELELDPNNGLIQGTPTRLGRYPVTIYASNAGGVSAAARFNLTVSPPTVVLRISAVPNTVTAASGQTPMFVLNRSGSNTQSDFVLRYTMRGSAMPGVDYQPLKGKVHFRPGEYVKTIKIVLLGDAGGPGHKRSIKFGAMSGSGPYRVTWIESSVIRIQGK